MAPTFGLFDRLKIKVILWVRRINRASIEGWSRSTFRRLHRGARSRPRLLAAQRHYGSTLLPPELEVPEELPPESRLSALYTVPYYLLSGTAFWLHQKRPISREVLWTPELDVGAEFPGHDEGWADIQEDRAFTALRVQGPNPFLLERIGPGRFEVDYGPYVTGVLAPLRCRFVVQDGVMTPDSIEVDGAVHRPGEPGWERAKFLANGYDARITVFQRHLAHTHLISGQSFSLSLYSLPADHPLHPMIEFFTYSTLVVNDFAFKLLVTPASYFLQANFLRSDQIQRLFENLIPRYRLEQLMPVKDVAERGIDEIPGHPYVEDGIAAWRVIEAFVGDYVRKSHPDDEAVRSDEALRGWYRELMRLLPDRDPERDRLEGLETLIETVSAIVYLNVSHEICGDFSPYSMSKVAEHKRLINVDNLLGEPQAPRASDVFLFDQGAFAGRFEHVGNFMCELDPDEVVADPSFRESLRAFQAALRSLDAEVAARNSQRAIPFHRARPSRWQASISY